MNRRGSVLDFYTIITLLAMCGLVLWGYSEHQNHLAGSLVSPLEVARLSDSLVEFEIAEESLIVKSLVLSDWGENNFEYEFLVKFVDSMDGEMRGFVLENLFWNGVNPVNDGFDEDSFFRNVLYDVDFDGTNLILSRNEVSKRFTMDASEKSKVSFPVEVEFDYEAKYLISKVGNKIEVERV